MAGHVRQNEVYINFYKIIISIVCLAVKKEKDIKSLHTSVKSVLEKTDIRKRTDKHFLNRHFSSPMSRIFARSLTQRTQPVVLSLSLS